MKVRKLLVTDIRCRSCNAAPGESCRAVLVQWGATAVLTHNSTHGERLAEHAELERAGWEWQEVDPTDKGARPRGGG